MVPAAAALDPIHLRSHGGDGSAEIEALLGDKILDLLLYWRLTRRFDIKNEGNLTQLRSVYVSNQTMAFIGESFVVPRHMNRFAWESASTHEKGTAVEAIVGRSFLQHNGAVSDFSQVSISPATVKIGFEILDAIERCVKTSASQLLAGLPQKPAAASSANSSDLTMGHKNPAQALFEWLQLKLKITKPAESITFMESSGIESGIQTEIKFVGVFQLPRNVKYGDVGAATDLAIHGDPCRNKNLARDNVARYVLRHFKIDSTLSLGSALRKPPPPSQLPPPSYVMPKAPVKAPPPFEKSSCSRLYEWLQKNGVSYPAKTIDIFNVLAEDDVTRDGAFQGVFVMPGSDPPVVVQGACCASKREAKENVAAAVIARFDVSLSRKRQRRSEPSFCVADLHQAGADLAAPVLRNDIDCNEDRSDNKKMALTASSCSIFRTCATSSATDSVSITNTATAMRSDADISGSIGTDSVSITNAATAMCSDADIGGPIGTDSGSITKAATTMCSGDNIGGPDDLARIWDKIQSGYRQAASADRRESIFCVERGSVESSLAFVNNYLSKYVRDARPVTHEDLCQVFLPSELDSDGNVALPSVAGLLHFEPHTPWDSAPLREWFETSWTKKPVNALCLLRVRIDAQFSIKFWRCRLNGGGLQTVNDALVLVAFWDGSFGPFYGVGAATNAGQAAKAALAQLWPAVRPHIDSLIGAAEQKYLETQQRATEATQMAIVAAAVAQGL